MNNKIYLKELRQLFASCEESIIQINATPLIYNYIFDFDGVLLKECNVIEKGYAWLIRALRDNNFDTDDLDINQNDLKDAKKIRPKVKGKSQAEKIFVVNEKYGNLMLSNELIEKIIPMWAGKVFTNFILQLFENNPQSYLLDGAENILKKTAQIGKVFGLTANIQPQADFLMEFVGLTKYFQEIVGFPVAINKNKNLSKQKMLQSLLIKHDLDVKQTCYIGDSPSDIKAGQGAGIFTIGIANNYSNGAKLIEQGCDIIATSTVAYSDILKVLSISK